MFHSIRTACRLASWIVLPILLGVTAASHAANSDRSGLLSFDAQALGVTIHYNQNWSVSPQFYSNQVSLVKTPQGAKTKTGSEAMAKVFTEPRHSHEDAVERLQTIARGMGAPASAFLEIGGWPAVQYGRIELRPKASKTNQRLGEEMYLVSTVIAAGASIVRMQALLPADASSELVEDARLLGQRLGFRAVGDPRRTRLDLEQLREAAKAVRIKAKSRLKNDGAAAESAMEEFSEHADAAPGFNQRVLFNGFGEVEIAVSPDAQNIVIGRQGDWVASNDGGQTFSARQTVAAFDGGDPSVAYAQSGAFYYAGIDRGCAPADPAGPNGYDCTGMAQSLDNGATFPLVTPAVVCPSQPNAPGEVAVPGMLGCFPDQEHIAADRWNAAPGGGDQVYSVWRNFHDMGGQDPAIVCSQDSGQTWTAPATVDNPGSASFPRVAVGSDGLVYVAYYDGGNFELRKYSSCANGLVPQPIVTVGTRTPVECPFPGHDRCDQNPTSQTVAVDDTNPNHVYYAYGNNSAAGTDHIFIRDSLDGGATWPAGRVVRVNANIPGNRIMPWVCTTEGDAYLTWYDRRAAPANQNDLTDFYAGRVGLDGGGNLTVLDEFRISEIGDPWCASGWPCGTRQAPGASESCSVQPQLAGYCTDGMGNTSNRCDFSNCGGVGMNAGGMCECAAGLVCNGGSAAGNAGGCPKYGDYNGNACMAGRLYASWASATTPPGTLPPTSQIGMLFDFFLLGDVPQVQVPGELDFGESCQADGTVNATLEVCNTGNAHLEVGTIVSDNPAFAVETPLGGFPVNISPDFCFPFNVEFTPAGEGPDSGTLTVNTDDPATPQLEVAVTASAGVAEIDTFIANDGDFSEVCPGLIHDLNLTIQSNGTCPLEIDGVSLVGGDAGDFDLPNGSLAGTVIEPGNSLLVPVRFNPVGNNPDPDVRMTTVRVQSSTQGGDSLGDDDTPVQGSVPDPDLNVAMANDGDFGAICKGDFADLDLTLFNQGRCDLTIDSITSSNPLFDLPGNTQYPLVLSHDADFTLPVRYAPVDCNDGIDSGNITINSDSPGEEVFPVAVSGTSPCPNLVFDPTALTGPNAFPATVVDDTGSLGCFSERTSVLRNNSICPLTITDISAAGADYTVMAPVNFPILLPGGEETLEVTVRFTPTSDPDPLFPNEVLGTLSVTSDDPDLPQEAELCGESTAQSGIRTLVTDITSGVPLIVDPVERMTVRTKGKKTPSPINLQFTDVAANSTSVCGNTVEWHLNLETLPATETTGARGGKSQYEVHAKEGNLQDTRQFPLDQCEFSEFQMQLKSDDGGGGACLSLPKGAACTSAAECCSGKCKGPSGGKTCK